MNLCEFIRRHQAVSAGPALQLSLVLLFSLQNNNHHCTIRPSLVLFCPCLLWGYHGIMFHHIPFFRNTEIELLMKSIYYFKSWDAEGKVTKMSWTNDSLILQYTKTKLSCGSH